MAADLEASVEINKPVAAIFAHMTNLESLVNCCDRGKEIHHDHLD